MRLPLNQIGALGKISKELNRFEQEHERRPSAEELSETIDLPEEKIDEAMSVGARHVSVDAPFADGEDNSLLDIMVNDSAPMADSELVQESLKTEIDKALSVLSYREREIIKAYYGLGQTERTLDEIGNRFGLTRERVRQIREKAIRRLKTSSINKSLKSYLGQ